MPTETLADKVILALTVIVLTFSAYTIFIWLPVALHAEAKCLKAGYPENQVTIGLEQYCLNLEGSVSVKVEQLENIN